jgi:hypothetical protein
MSAIKAVAIVLFASSGISRLQELFRDTLVADAPFIEDTGLDPGSSH